MLTNGELSILQSIAKKSLIKKSELLKISNGAESSAVEKSLEFLKDNGLIDIVTPMGETSFAITQKGMRFASNGSES